MDLFELPEGSYGIHLSWSADGKQLAFVQSSRSIKQVFSMDIDTKKIVQLTKLEKDCNNLSWSPNGKIIVFDTADDHETIIYMKNLETKKLSEISKLKRV
ncbi:MAG: PD40 domain-containing protein [Anaerolineaceae bacterium]|nr:PD40 domain-containing protein [Anaerolineaceae bacterium]